MLAVEDIIDDDNFISKSVSDPSFSFMTVKKRDFHDCIEAGFSPGAPKLDQENWGLVRENNWMMAFTAG